MKRVKLCSCIPRTIRHVDACYDFNTFSTLAEFEKLTDGAELILSYERAVTFDRPRLVYGGGGLFGDDEGLMSGRGRAVAFAVQNRDLGPFLTAVEFAKGYHNPFYPTDRADP